MGVDLAWAVLGLGILVLAGDLLVRGAVAASLRLGIPALIVSLTVVALGTSAPELLIAVLAVLDGVPGLALGNVVGSNTANVLLVLGLPALISGIRTDAVDTRRSYLLMLGASVLFIAICFAGPIRWPHALVLLGALALWLGDSLARCCRPGCRPHSTPRTWTTSRGRGRWPKCLLQAPSRGWSRSCPGGRSFR